MWAQIIERREMISQFGNNNFLATYCSTNRAIRWEVLNDSHGLPESRHTLIVRGNNLLWRMFLARHNMNSAKYISKTQHLNNVKSVFPCTPQTGRFFLPTWGGDKNQISDSCVGFGNGEISPNDIALLAACVLLTAFSFRQAFSV